MKKMIPVLGVMMSLFVSAFAEDMTAPVTPAPEVVAPASSVELVKSALGTGVDRETRSIQGEAASFDASVTNVYFLTRVKASAVPTTVNHVYSVDGKETVSVPLSVKGSPWTTWSYRTIWPGAWKVELKDEAGNVIDSKEFTVSKDMAAPAPMETAPAQP
jgi:hypothetical protein